MIFHHFDRFVAEYEERFEQTYGYFRPIVKVVLERYLDCGNPTNFAAVDRIIDHLKPTFVAEKPPHSWSC